MIFLYFPGRSVTGLHLPEVDWRCRRSLTCPGWPPWCPPSSGSPASCSPCLGATSSCWPLCLGATSSCWPLCLGATSRCWPLCLGATYSCWPLCLGATSSCWPLCLGATSSCWPLCLGATSSCWPLNKEPFPSAMWARLPYFLYYFLRTLSTCLTLKGGLYFETGLTACVTQLTQLSPPHHRSDLVHLPKIVTFRRQCCR